MVPLLGVHPRRIEVSLLHLPVKPVTAVKSIHQSVDEFESKNQNTKRNNAFFSKKETLTRRVGRKLEGVSHSLGSRKDSHTVASVGQQVGDGGRDISSLQGGGQIAL